jgi:hypothetical protein
MTGRIEQLLSRATMKSPIDGGRLLMSHTEEVTTMDACG